MPDITPRGKVSPDKTTLVPFWRAGAHADDMMESKGWKKPENNTDDESWLWLIVAGICALCSVGCFVFAYVTHIHEGIGAGAILGTFAVVATGISAIVGWIGWIVGAALVCGLIWAGVRLRNWSFTKWMRQ
jgi:hypothetical protein